MNGGACSGRRASPIARAWLLTVALVAALSGGGDDPAFGQPEGNLPALARTPPGDHPGIQQALGLLA